MLYRGRVQGVGFRATCQGVAARFAVDGWVRNLPDGRVELAAEGEPAEVAAFIDAVAERMGEYVSGAAIHDEPVRGESGFRIEH